jgi:CDGSH-type Zn-finger protein
MPDNSTQKIEIQWDGPYRVTGGVPLVRKVQVVTEAGEPVAWQKTAALPANETYKLCRCGKSREKPFCDFSHCDGFDGTETADTSPTAARQTVLAKGSPPERRITVRRDTSVCMEAGFCANRFGRIDDLLANLDDPRVLTQVIAMIERCPSGSYSYTIEPEGAEIEPDLPLQIAVVTEMTSEGPIMGPLWITGGIPIERSDGAQVEPRNRVTLCRCGLSKIKPLCDGTHRARNIKE